MNFTQAILSFVLAATLGGVPAAAQQTQAQQPTQPMQPRRGMAAGGMMNCNCSQIMTQMAAEMRTMDANLDQKLAAMNVASGQAKIDAMSAVINEMVQQRKQMMSRMMNMQGGGMMARGAKPNCPMMAQPSR